ncbi:N-acetylmuramic acid 6-phosphate etherase [Raoultella sp. BIGb0138]|uniref:N-acetylmuramic acid 6-phosphate etherase n=1 Tax=Raoultella sp. BIGb0138 TaxID=2485115 RepID=UPI0010507129|nr:N-acetylmuramic acid 6-phosphate etherase [Raoultella sp. BIGb0138]TCW08671.1 N-acetylmuramic acid 6-phosphate etherase [Raoultella sp. BIGb0138]
MSSKPTASMMERRHPETRHIDSLATLDMLTMLHQDDRQITDAIAACLPEIARLVDNAAAALSRGGRLVIIGAGASGRAALQTVSEFAPEEKHSLIGLIAGGPAAALQEMETAANDYDSGALELQALQFGRNDMLLALTVSGQTPWVWGAMRHAWSLGAPIAVLTQQASSEAAQLADMVIAPQTGPEAVAGYGNPKAQLAQRQILAMLTTGLAIREGRVYSNLRVDLQATSPRWAERQMAIVMTATGCSRSEAKAALASCNQHCRTAILMLMTGLGAWQARELLAENNDHLRIALRETKRTVLSPAN